MYDILEFVFVTGLFVFVIIKVRKIEILLKETKEIINE